MPPDEFFFLSSSFSDFITFTNSPQMGMTTGEAYSFKLLLQGLKQPYHLTYSPKHSLNNSSFAYAFDAHVTIAERGMCLVCTHGKNPPGKGYKRSLIVGLFLSNLKLPILWELPGMGTVPTLVTTFKKRNNVLTKLFAASYTVS